MRVESQILAEETKNLYLDTREELEDKINQSSSYVFVRAIRPDEFIQLQKDGPEKFEFIRGRNFDTHFSLQVLHCAMLYTGCVIMHEESEKHIAYKRFYHHYLDNWWGREYLPWFRCRIDFTGEVYVCQLFERGALYPDHDLD